MNPSGVLPVIQSIPLDEIRDHRARRFISALLARRGELTSADSMTQSQIATATAFSLGLAAYYLEWVSLVPMSDKLFSDIAAEIVREVKRLAITKFEVGKLEKYAAECIEYARNGGVP